MAEIDVQCQSLFIVFVCAVKQHEAGKEWANIACFYFDIKNNTEVLGIFNLTLVGIQSVRKTGITSENDVQTVRKVLKASSKGPGTGHQFNIQFPPSLASLLDRVK